MTLSEIRETFCRRTVDKSAQSFEVLLNLTEWKSAASSWGVEACIFGLRIAEYRLQSVEAIFASSSGPSFRRSDEKVQEYGALLQHSHKAHGPEEVSASNGPLNRSEPLSNDVSPRIVNALLVAVGVSTLHYMSRHSQAKRDDVVQSFNNPSSHYTCLVTSLQLSAFGVNFHKACHRGLILEMPANLSIVFQAMGRLWSLGQKHNVH
ncbi:hypothetical protein H0G86_001124 [Trichoderma simmonsii]|uniref:Helicase C-terminal domain-containing protein n=1 Tax=Trichoderma simmonsii TaxID=1491479 RepID=A0A8G0L667_9HYPO|nr:hypothetical protein H0G86_001124 [Trichoderma simmonsii]